MADRRQLGALQERLGVPFNDSSLLATALVHSSYLNENPEYGGGSNERLEFLGDAVLGLVVADRLFAEFPSLSEGALTALRVELVRAETLGQVAERLGLGAHLLLSRGEENAGARARPLILARALEAVIGALWLDQGLNAVTGALDRWMVQEWERVAAGEVEVDPKTRLQHLAQGRLQQTPAYRVVAQEGPDHARVFTVEVVLGDRVMGEGQGASKQAAEKEAARSALRSLTPEG